MTDLDLTNLERFANPEADKPAPRKGKGSQKSWHLPEAHEFHDCSIIAVDASLRACGVVFMSVNADHRIEVTESHVLSAPSGSENWEMTLKSGYELEEAFERLLRGRPYRTIVHEAPPIGGGKFANPELAVLSSYAIRRAAITLGFRVAPMITAQTHKRLICGNGNAKKPVEHAVLKDQLAPSLPILGFEQITNEAKRDALCVGLAHSLQGAPRGN